MTLASDARLNHLLAALPGDDLARWLPELERVELPFGNVLYESSGTLSHVYFPTTAIVSLLYNLENGASAEIAVVGNEGIVGIALFMGGNTTPNRAVVQSAGLGLRDQQLCRWLLISLDRLNGNELHMTQELIATMLGVRREGVTESALKLQKAGLIRYSRGHITVLDREGLERQACECYAVVKNEYARLLPDRVAT
ncbi:MAG: Crp/Fnr family transcriptional regulator [Cytophagales bacterium]|nr:Crp/Fnr family transcriptional regulator [Rhizobacter sp.]